MAASTIPRGACTINGVPLYGDKSSQDLGIATTQILESVTGQSVANNTNVNMKNVTLDAGFWLIEVIVVFASGNATGYRRCGFQYAESDGTQYYAHSSVKAAASANTTIVYCACPVPISAAYPTVSIYARQNSGSALSGVAGYLYAHKLR